MTLLMQDVPIRDLGKVKSNDTAVQVTTNGASSSMSCRLSSNIELHSL